MKPVLVACEESQRVTIALRNNGIEAYSCDLKPTSGNHPKWHIQTDVLEIIGDSYDWGGIIAFPDCTYLTVSANKWYKDQPKRKSGALVGGERRQARHEAICFFLRFVGSKCPNVAIENPIGIMSTVYRKPEPPNGQIIHPWMFGHPEQKATCLWLKGFPLLKPTNDVRELMKNMTDAERQKLHYLPPSKNRAELRSKTFPGIADAIGYQYSEYLKGENK